MIINGIMKYDCKFEELNVGEVFSFADERRKIWDGLHQYSSIEEYEERSDEDSKSYKKNYNNYMGEDLYMLCWHSIPEFADDECAFHPKFISLKDGCIHDIIEEQEFTNRDYYSDVRVYDSCRETEPSYDDESEYDEWA